MFSFCVAWAPTAPCPECTGVLSITWSQGDFSVCMCSKCTGAVREFLCVHICGGVRETEKGVGVGARGGGDRGSGGGLY